MNEKRLPLGHQYGVTPARCRDGYTTRYCMPMPTASLPRSKASVERIALFHYTTRSWEDFEMKMERAGGLNPRGKGVGYFKFWAKCVLRLLCACVCPLSQAI